jgi:CRISPR system Cascade subunit CasC
MLIEIHLIQNHSPSNLNRDDLGAPKTCIFGGVTRARISSQCLKRSIRRSADFAAALERDGGVRTRRLAHVLARIAKSQKFDYTPEQLQSLLVISTMGVDSELEDRARVALAGGGLTA